MQIECFLTFRRPFLAWPGCLFCLGGIYRWKLRKIIILNEIPIDEAVYQRELSPIQSHFLLPQSKKKKDKRHENNSSILPIPLGDTSRNVMSVNSTQIMLHMELFFHVFTFNSQFVRVCGCNQH